MDLMPRFVLATALLAAMAGARAGDTPPRPDAAPQDQAAAQAAPSGMPAWEQLTPAQRDLLIAPMRERWNANPADRTRMYQHAERWRTMSPGERAKARRGLGHWEHMDPARRREMRALFETMRTMTPEQRKALRTQWRGMTQAQRKAWVEAHPPKGGESH